MPSEEWLCISIVLLPLLGVYCARQEPRWPFVAAAIIGALVGLGLVGYGLLMALAFGVVGGPSLLGWLGYAASFVTIGPCLAVAVVGLLVPPWLRLVGSLAGGLTAWVALHPLMLLLPEGYFEGWRHGALAVPGVAAIIGALIGAHVGVLYPGFGPTGQRALLAGTCLALIVSVLTWTLKSDEVALHVGPARQLREASDVEALLGRLESSDPRVRAGAVRALGRRENASDERVVSALIGALKDPGVPVGDSARAVANLGDPRAVPALIEVVKDKGVRGRGYAAEALGKFRDPEAVPALIELVRGGSSAERRYAAKALGQIGDARALETLIELLKERDHDQSCAAAEALGLIGDERAVPHLLELARGDLKIANPRTAAVNAVAGIGGDEAVRGLIELLRDDRWYVRREAAKALGHLGDPRAVPALTELVTDGLSGKAAREALAQIGTPEGLAAVEQLTKREETFAQSIGELWEAGDVDGIILHLTAHQDLRARDAAVFVLRSIGNERATQALRAAMKDDRQNWRVREAAAGAIAATADTGSGNERKAAPAALSMTANYSPELHSSDYNGHLVEFVVENAPYAGLRCVYIVLWRLPPGSQAGSSGKGGGGEECRISHRRKAGGQSVDIVYTMAPRKAPWETFTANDKAFSLSAGRLFVADLSLSPPRVTQLQDELLGHRSDVDWASDPEGAARDAVETLRARHPSRFAFLTDMPGPGVGLGSRARRAATALAREGGKALQRGDTATATAKYREAIRIQPGAAFAHYGLAQALRAQGDTEGAIQEFRQAARLGPGSKLAESAEAAVARLGG